MATYIYTGQTISEATVLLSSLKDNGLSDATFIIDGSSVTVVTAGLETTCDTAVADANDGTLYANKEIRKDETRENTLELVDSGVLTWSVGDTVKLTKKTANGYYEDWTYLTANSSKITSDQPYVLVNLDGDEISTTSLSDIKALADRAADRWSYLIDGQKDLTDAIDAAANQTALNAITDSRT